ncbi:unnamed protein product, partial [Sphacelaria rigidula]
LLAQHVLRYRCVNRWPAGSKRSQQRYTTKQVTVNLKTLGVGDVIGEDCVLGFETRQYQVVAKTQEVETCIVPRKNVLLYLTSSELDALYEKTQ